MSAQTETIAAMMNSALDRARSSLTTAQRKHAELSLQVESKRKDGATIIARWLTYVGSMDSPGTVTGLRAEVDQQVAAAEKELNAAQEHVTKLTNIVANFQEMLALLDNARAEGWC